MIGGNFMLKDAKKKFEHNEKFAWKFLTEHSSKTEILSLNYDVNDHVYIKSKSV